MNFIREKMMEQLTFVEQLQQFIDNHTIMVIAWVAILIAVLVSLYKGVTSKIQIVDNAGLTALLNNEEGLVLDIRSEDDFRTGHIIESQHLFPTDIKTGKVQSIEKFKERPIIVVDNNGLTAQGIAEHLAKQGFSKVYALKEGILGWRAANLPLVKKHK